MAQDRRVPAGADRRRGGKGDREPAVGEDRPALTAIEVAEGAADFKIVPAPTGRDWMSATRHEFAKRCLPLLIANQHGWEVLSPVDVSFEWDGGETASAVRVIDAMETPAARGPATSHFGHGIVTWTIPYLFRTSPGFNLLVRGPANRPKDGIAALEGVVETDWSPATFTMNWQFTRPGVVGFRQDEPIALLVPCRRGELERFDTATATFSDGDPQLIAEYRAWRTGRAAFLADLPFSRSSKRRDLWQGDYFRGELGALPGGATAHQTRLRLKDFRERPESRSADPERSP